MPNLSGVSVELPQACGEPPASAWPQQQWAHPTLARAAVAMGSLVWGKLLWPWPQLELPCLFAQQLPGGPDPPQAQGCQATAPWPSATFLESLILPVQLLRTLDRGCGWVCPSPFLLQPPGARIPPRPVQNHHGGAPCNSWPPWLGLSVGTTWELWHGLPLGLWVPGSTSVGVGAHPWSRPLGSGGDSGPMSCAPEKAAAAGGQGQDSCGVTSYSPQSVSHHMPSPSPVLQLQHWAKLQLPFPYHLSPIGTHTELLNPAGPSGRKEESSGCAELGGGAGCGSVFGGAGLGLGIQCGTGQGLWLQGNPALACQQRLPLLRCKAWGRYHHHSLGAWTGDVWEPAGLEVAYAGTPRQS